MMHLGSRRFLAGLVGLVVLAGAALLPEPARADKALFRVKTFAIGGVTTFTSPVEPTVGTVACGQLGAVLGTTLTSHASVPKAITGTLCPPGNLGSTSPVAKFTLPKSFHTYMSTYVYTGYTGYTSVSVISSYNGQGNFRPNNPYGAVPSFTPTAMQTAALGTGPIDRVLFPTTMGNPVAKIPNQGAGYAQTPTTWFTAATPRCYDSGMASKGKGCFDFSRGGSLRITPGPNKFGGTIRFLYGPGADFYQFITFNSPFISKAYGSFHCQLEGGAFCTTQEESTPGQITSSGMVSRFQLTPSGLNKNKTSMGINYVSSKAYYLHMIAPWTTGRVVRTNPLNAKSKAKTVTGYNSTFPAGTTRSFTYSNTTPTSMGTSTTTTMKTLMGITRITSMVRPRLVHVYLQPGDTAQAITTNFQAARIAGLNVYFLPEPGSLLMIGTGVALLAGLVRFRRR